MRQIDVDLKFNEDEEPTFFVSEDGYMMWKVEDVLMFDWREEPDISSLQDEVVILFDGSDCIIFASVTDMIEG